MQVVLVMFKSGGERRSFSIVRDVTVIGRREDCDFRIPLGEISRKHCRLIKDDGALRVEDLGSSNGTFHNGKRVQEATLEPGDTLRVGSIAFVVQIEGVPADDEMHPQTGTSAEADSAAGMQVSAGESNAESATLDEDASSETVRRTRLPTPTPQPKPLMPTPEDDLPAEDLVDPAVANSDFDPMAVLSADDPESSGVAPSIGDSAIGREIEEEHPTHNG